MKKIILLFTILMFSASLFAQVTEYENQEKTSETAKKIEKIDAAKENEDSAENVSMNPEEDESEEFDETSELSDEDIDLEEFEESELNRKRKLLQSENRIQSPHRVFEMGFSTSIGFSDNYFNLSEMLVSDLVIDLRKIADELSKEGLIFRLSMAPDFFMNLNLKNGVHAGLSAGVEAYGDIILSKDLFEFLGYGNSFGETIKVDSTAAIDAFAHLDFSVGLDIIKDHHLEITPSLFLPLIHAEVASGTRGSLTNRADGGFIANANSEIGIYSFTDVQGYIDSEAEKGDILSSFGKGWGFDISTSVEKRVLSNLVCKAYGRIPIVPGQLNYSAVLKAGISADIENLNSLINKDSDDDDDSRDFVESESSYEWEYKNDTYSLNRPLRIGGEACWQPFGSWFDIIGLLGFGVKEPFSEGARGYVEYNFGCKVSLPVPVIGDMLSCSLSTGYLAESFIHQAGFEINFRFFELDAGVSAQGGDFVSSFKGSGIGAYIMLAFGW